MNYFIQITGKTNVPELPDKDKDISAVFECLRLKKIIQDPSNDEMTYQYESVGTATLLDGKSAIRGKPTGKLSVVARLACRDTARQKGIDEDKYYAQRMYEFIDEEKAKQV